MRDELKVLRIRKHLKQGEIAEKLGVSRSTYSLIERGVVQGSTDFWNSLQREFEIPDAEMFILMKKADT